MFISHTFTFLPTKILPNSIGSFKFLFFTFSPHSLGFFLLYKENSINRATKSKSERERHIENKFQHDRSKSLLISNYFKCKWVK